MIKICFSLVIPMVLFANIYIEGSTTIRPVVKEAAKEFSAKSGIKIHIKGGGSSRGLAALKEGNCDIAMVSKPLTDADHKTFKVHTLARDAVAIIVHAVNVRESITTKEVIDIYSGKMAHWKTNAKITVVDKNSGRGTKKVFDNYFKIENISRESYRVGSNTETVLYVSTDRNAIGYVSVGAAEKAIEKGLQIKILSLEGKRPTLENIKNGTYLLGRTLSLVTLKQSTEETERFVDFLLSGKSEKFIRKQHYIPIANRK